MGENPRMAQSCGSAKVGAVSPCNNPAGRQRQASRCRSQRVAPQRFYEAVCGHPPAVQPLAPRAVSSGARRGGPIGRPRGPSRGRSRGVCGGNHRSALVCGPSVVTLEPAPTTAVAEDVIRSEAADALAQPTEPAVAEQRDAVLLAPEEDSDEDSGLWFCAKGAISDLLDEAVDDYAEEAVREVVYANEAPQVFPEFEPPIPEAEDEDAEEEDDSSEDSSEDATTAKPEYECEKISETNGAVAAALTLSVILEAVGGMTTGSCGLTNFRREETTTESSETVLDAEIVMQDEDDAVSVVSSPASESDNDDAPVLVQRIAEDIVCGGGLPSVDEILSASKEAAREPEVQWPSICRLAACTRPRFERRLRPSTAGPPVPEAPFPMDCLPLSAPVARSLPPSAELSLAGRRLAGLPVLAARPQPPFFSVDSLTVPPRLSDEAEEILLRRASESLAALANAARKEAADTIQRKWRYWHRTKARAPTPAQFPKPAEAPRTLESQQPVALAAAPAETFTPAPPAAPPACGRPRGGAAPRRRMLGLRASTAEAAVAPVEAPATPIAPAVPVAPVAPPAPAGQTRASPSPRRPVPPCAAPAPAGELKPMVPTAPTAPRTARPGSRPGSAIRSTTAAQAQAPTPPVPAAAAAPPPPCPESPSGPSPAARAPSPAAAAAVRQPEPPIGRRETGTFAGEPTSPISPRPPSSRHSSRPSSGARRLVERPPQPQAASIHDGDASARSNTAHPPRPPLTPRTPRATVAPVPTPAAGQRFKRFTPGAASSSMESPHCDAASIGGGNFPGGSGRERESSATALELDLGLAAATAVAGSSTRQASASTWARPPSSSPRPSAAMPVPPESPRIAKAVGTGLLPALPAGPSAMNSSISWSVGVSTTGIATPRTVKHSIDALKRLR